MDALRHAREDLIDHSAIAHKLAQGAPPLPMLRDALRAGRKNAAERFWAGVPATRLVPALADLLDTVLQGAWRAQGLDETALSLVAVGGYGRGELHPGSDVDILILTPEEGAPVAAVEGFIQLAWDVGAEIAHSVRTIAECESAAQADITVVTNIMESRCIAGSETLFRQLRRRMGPDSVWPSPAFFEAKWQEQISRHRKYHDTAYNLEPNVKEGPGGLRDIQNVGWVAKRHFGVESLRGLVDQDFLTAEEHNALMGGQAFLWQIRFALHLLTDRGEDRLLFDHQKHLAEGLGYEDEPHRLGVEQMMQHYFQTLGELSRLNDMLLQHFQEAILMADTPVRITRLNDRFQLRNAFLEATDPQLFELEPRALMEVFEILAEHPEIPGVRASTIRMIRDNRHRVDEQFRRDPEVRRDFIRLFQRESGLTHALRRMHRYGILGRYLPAFGLVTGQMQYDLFHVYTVDEHTLFVIRNLRRMASPEFADELPRCSALMSQLSRRERLYIAGLFHDIAKGRGGDHSELGSEDARAFCESHGVDEDATATIVWLVRHHLLLSTTAQRRDISDPQVINEFAAQVGDREHLDLLYLMTVADIRATNPNLWNAWKDALLAELYEATAEVLDRGLTQPAARSEWVAETEDAALAGLLEQGYSEQDVRRVWQYLDTYYFLRHTPDEIIWQTGQVLEAEHSGQPHVALRHAPERGGTEIFIYSQGHDHIFAASTAAMEQLGLNVVDARILVVEGVLALHSFIALEEDGDPIQEGFRLQEIEATIREALVRPETIGPHRGMPQRRLRQFSVPTQVAFREDRNGRMTVMEVTAADRPGVLSRIAQAMEACEVRLQKAKIATLGERVEDIFFITDADRQPLTDPRDFDCLKRRIRAVLDEEPGG